MVCKHYTWSGCTQEMGSSENNLGHRCPWLDELSHVVHVVHVSVRDSVCANRCVELRWCMLVSVPQDKHAFEAVITVTPTHI